MKLDVTAMIAFSLQVSVMAFLDVAFQGNSGANGGGVDLTNSPSKRSLQNVRVDAGDRSANACFPPP